VLHLVLEDLRREVRGHRVLSVDLFEKSVIDGDGAFLPGDGLLENLPDERIRRGVPRKKPEVGREQGFLNFAARSNRESAEDSIVSPVEITGILIGVPFRSPTRRAAS